MTLTETSDNNPLTETKCAYRPFSEKYYSEDIGTYIAYGISVYCGEAELLRISDICADRCLVEDLCRRCTEGELDPIHIYEVIEDFLGS